MNTPSFKTQFDKITRAYFNDEIRPEVPCACFIGNLLNNEGNWEYARRFTEHFPAVIEKVPGSTNCVYMLKAALSIIERESNGLYTLDDIIALETNFLNIARTGKPIITEPGDIDKFHTEESLFAAIDSTLDLLRTIHENHGEVIEDFEFRKRTLTTK